MKTIFRFVLTILICCNTHAVTAADLIDLYNLAKDYDPTIQQAYQNNLAQLEAYPQARAVLLPQISATANKTPTRYDANGEVSNFVSWGGSLAITQTILRWDLWHQLSQAKDQVKIAYAILADAEQDLLYRLADRYFDILAAKDNLALLQAKQKAARKELQQTKQSYQVGLFAITDLLEAQAAFDNTIASVIQAENDLINAKDRLTAIVGKETASIAPLKTNIELHKPSPANIEKWVNLATEQNWQLQIARYNLDLARKQIQVQKAGHFPSLGVAAGINRNKAGISSQAMNLSTANTIGLQVTLPLFAGGKVVSQVNQAQHNYAAAIDALEKTFRATELNTRVAYRGVLTTLSQIKAYGQAVISNASALKAIQSAYTVGNRTVVDVFNAQSQLINAENDYAQSRYSYILQGLALKQQAGNLTVADLQEVNCLLQQNKTAK